MNKNVLAIFAGAAGAAAGWAVKYKKEKRSSLEENKPLLERLKQAERKLYEAGRQRDEQLKQIKSEINHKVSQ
ncbi:hypothetical protein [Oceanobacillus kapialis]|uniref:hypothetical protein n=1 Tax=Oceanobacillus kapialis TaxID=481353 RepID=UPI00384E5F80